MECNPCLIKNGWQCWEQTVVDILFGGEENDTRENIIICNPRQMGHVARMGERRGVYTALVGKPEGKKPLGTPRHRWEDNIKMDLHEVMCGVWAGSSWLRIGTGSGTRE